MANPIDFKGSNVTFGAPHGMTAEECGDLPCFFDGGVVVSCWELTEKERAYVAETGCVWLMVWGGGTPPVCVVGESPLVEVEVPLQKENVQKHPRWGEYMAFCRDGRLLPTDGGFRRWLEDATKIIIPGEVTDNGR